MSRIEPSVQLSRSSAYLREARTVLARGSGSAARVRRLGPTPVIASAAGARCRDLDGNTYIDYFLAFGPLFLGHRPRPVISAVQAFLAGDGLICGGPHVHEAELARLIAEAVPCAERVVLSTTGSEAVQAAIRIARAKTRRRTILKFDGHYHGWIEPVNVNALGTEPVPGAPPLRLIPSVAEAGLPGEVIVCPWNDIPALESTLTQAGDDIACVLMEPIPCNFGTFLPQPGYLEACVALCRAHGAVLIFDEVVTGFRLALGGAQELVGVTPDMAVLAKAIASGFSIAAVVGTAEAMAPVTDGPVYTAGTYNGAAPSVVAAIATLTHLREQRDSLYPRVFALSERLANGINDASAEAGLPLFASQVGPVIQLLWRPRHPLRNYLDARTCDPAPVAMLTGLVLADGVLVHERGLMFVSAAHTEPDIDQTIDAFERGMVALAAMLDADAEP